MIVKNKEGKEFDLSTRRGALGFMWDGIHKYNSTDDCPLDEFYSNWEFLEEKGVKDGKEAK